MRRHLGGRVAQQRPAVERHRLAGRARQVRRRDPRAGLAGPPAEYRPRGGYGAQGGRRHGRRAGRHRLHARPRTGRIAARGRVVHQGAFDRPQHPDGRGQSPAGTHPLAFHRPAGPAIAPPVIPVPLPAGERRAHADRARGLPDPNADHRHDDRRRRGRSVRQVRQGDGTALPGRSGDRPPGPGGRSEGVPFRAAPCRGIRLLVLGAEDFVSLHAARRRGLRPGVRRTPQGRPLRLVADDHRRNPARQARARLEGDGHPRHRHRRRRLGQLGPARRHRRDGPPARLAHVPARIQVHHRQRRDDRHGGLLPLQAGRSGLARRFARRPAGEHVTGPIHAAHGPDASASGFFSYLCFEVRSGGPAWLHGKSGKCYFAYE